MRTLPIHQSLHRNVLVMGAEREPALMLALAAFLIGVGGMTLFYAFFAVFIYVLGIILLRIMSKHDPLMTKVWRRHIKLQIFYPAKSSIWRKQK